MSKSGDLYKSFFFWKLVCNFIDLWFKFKLLGEFNVLDLLLDVFVLFNELSLNCDLLNEFDV